MAGLDTSPQLRSQTTFVPIHGQRVEVALHQHPQASDTILMLHEALGSVAYWKDFPQKLALATGSNVILYSRAGQGNSEGQPSARTLDAYLHEVREVIPALLAHFAAHVATDRPVVYGHSEGAGLAMMYAARSQRVKSLILESPFLTGLKQSADHIRGLAENYQGSRMQQRLGQYHRDADAVFKSWIEGIASMPANRPAFGESIRDITCPVLALQGEDDEFGTQPHLDALLEAMPHMQHQIFAATGHLPHRQRTQAVLERVSRFLAQQQGVSP